MGKLFRRITEFQILNIAWQHIVDNKPSAGIDGVTIQDFARHWESNLIELQSEVRSNRYKPLPLKHFTIPKKDGSPRPMVNLSMLDKIIQRATVEVLTDIFEPLFLDCSHGRRTSDACP